MAAVDRVSTMTDDQWSAFQPEGKKDRHGFSTVPVLLNPISGIFVLHSCNEPLWVVPDIPKAPSSLGSA